MSTLLDTCVISELYRAGAEPAVESEVNALRENVYISVVTISEMSFGAHSFARWR